MSESLKFIDTHAHYDDPRYDADLHELFERVQRDGVFKVINAASDINAARKGIALSERYPFLFAAVGVHPHYAAKMTDAGIAEIRELAKREKVVAYGETGLDFYYKHSDASTQRYWFSKQLELAQELALPVIIHSRDAAEEVYNTLKASGADKGVVHCYTGSPEMAHRFIGLGFHIGVGGVITFKNAKKIVDTVREIDITKILLETDCPYLSPEPYRGTRNHSGNILLIAERVAEIKGMTVHEVCAATNANARALFDI